MTRATMFPSEMEKAFDDYFGEPFGVGFLTGPRVDAYRDRDRWVAHFDLPNHREEELTVRVVDGALQVKETGTGRLLGEMKLPGQVEPTPETRYTDETLEVRLPFK